MNYTDIHWGTGPREDIELTCPKGSAKPIGELKAVSYATVKAGKADVYRHQFKRFHDATEGRKRGPYLLRLSPDGNFQLNGIEKDTIAIGNTVDLEMVDGKVYVPPAGSFLVTDSNGSRLWLVGLDIPYDIEKREEGPIVTVRGIEA